MTRRTKIKMKGRERKGRLQINVDGRRLKTGKKDNEEMDKKEMEGKGRVHDAKGSERVTRRKRKQRGTTRTNDGRGLEQRGIKARGIGKRKGLEGKDRAQIAKRNKRVTRRRRKQRRTRNDKDQRRKRFGRERHRSTWRTNRGLLTDSVSRHHVITHNSTASPNR